MLLMQSTKQDSDQRQFESKLSFAIFFFHLEQPYVLISMLENPVKFKILCSNIRIIFTQVFATLKPIVCCTYWLNFTSIVLDHVPLKMTPQRKILTLTVIVREHWHNFLTREYCWLLLPGMEI